MPRENRFPVWFFLSVMALGIAAAPSQSRADCSDPPAPEGRLVYNSTYKVAQFCDGTNWISMAGGGAGGNDPRIGTLAAGKWCAANGTGDGIECTADAPAAIAGSDKQVIFNDDGALAGAAQLFWDKASNSLGIGTSAPTALLEVNSGTYSTRLAGASLLFSRNAANYIWGTTAGGYLVFGGNGLSTSVSNANFYTSGVGQDVIFNGRVGIGMSVPASRLHIAGSVQMANDTADCPGESDIKLGAMRYNAGAFSVCVPGGWTPLATAATASAAGSTGQIQFNGGSGTFAADAGLHWDNTNKRLGIRTAAPTAPLSFSNVTGDKIYLYDTTASQYGFGVYAAELRVFSGAPGGTAITFGDQGNSVFTEKMRIDANGNIGIGTAAPSNKLHVVINGTGVIRLTDSTAPSSVIYMGEGGSGANTFLPLFYGRPVGASLFTGLYSDIDAAEDTGTVPAMQFVTRIAGPAVIANRPLFVWKNNAATMMQIQANGNVGIGVTSPESKLQIHGSTTTGNITSLLLSQGTASAGEQNSLVFKVSTHYGAAIAMETLSTSDFDMVFKTNTAGGNNLVEKMRITHDGNLGIGTATPSAKAEIYGTAQLTAALTDAGSRGAILALNSNASTAGNGGAITFGNSQSLNAGSIGFAAIKGLLQHGGGNTLGSIAFATRNAIADTALTERMRIDHIGNVGIGTAEPSGKLDVNGLIVGGFGAASTTGGTLDWNHASNARSGNGHSLMYGSSTNGPGGAYYYHPFSFEYATKNGTGSMTQFAVSYADSATSIENGALFIRGRYQGTWTGWYRFTTAAVSDYRTKENIHPMNDSLNRVMQLRPVHFNYKTGYGVEGEQDGFLAHELQEVAAYSVVGRKDAVDDKGTPQMQSVDLARLTPLLAAAIQELKAENDNLRARLDAVDDHHKRTIESLRDEIDALVRHSAFVR